MCLGAPLPQGAAAVGQSFKPLAPLPCLGFELVGLDKPVFQELPFEAEVQQEAKQEKATVNAPEGVSHTDVDDQLLGKTKLCKFFSRGFCSRGRACTFAHGRKELKPVPNLYKTEMCFEFASTGRCMRGNACKYAHREEELRAPTVNNKASKPRRNSSEKEKVLATKLEEMEREAHQLRAQLKALEIAAEQQVTSSSSSRCSALTSTASGTESPRSLAGNSEDDVVEEELMETAFVVKNCSFSLVPATSSRVRARSVPRAMA